MTLERIAVLGDVHAEDVHLAAALERVRGDVDAVLCVGDVVDGKGDVNRCCELLRANDVKCVTGNHGRWMFANEMRVLQDANLLGDVSEVNREWLGALPRTMELDVVGGSLLLCHGLGDKDMKTLLPDDSGYALQSNDALEKLLYETAYRYVVKGHSHRRMVRKIDGLRSSMLARCGGSTTRVFVSSILRSEPCSSPSFVMMHWLNCQCRFCRKGALRTNPEWVRPPATRRSTSVSSQRARKCSSAR